MICMKYAWNRLEPKTTMCDLLNNILISSDLFIASLRQKSQNKKKILQQESQNLLNFNDCDDDVNDSEMKNSSNSDMDGSFTLE